MKKLLYILPLSLAVIISSCGSKDEKKEEGKSESPETACDCFDLLYEKTKSATTMDEMTKIQEGLDKDYPDCNKMVTEYMKKFQNPEDASKDCEAFAKMMEHVNAMIEKEMANMEIPMEDSMSMEEPVEPATAE